MRNLCANLISTVQINHFIEHNLNNKSSDVILLSSYTTINFIACHVNIMTY